MRIVWIVLISLGLADSVVQGQEPNSATNNAVATESPTFNGEGTAPTGYYRSVPPDLQTRRTNPLRRAIRRWFGSETPVGETVRTSWPGNEGLADGVSGPPGGSPSSVNAMPS